jgi:hypothetical protein
MFGIARLTSSTSGEDPMEMEAKLLVNMNLTHETGDKIRHACRRTKAATSAAQSWLQERNTRIWAMLSQRR